jgi:apolipoprotein N-acyltransferase
LAQLRLRAIEQGLPIVRAANTGISTVIDPYGSYVARLGIGHEDVIDSVLPQSLPPTPFAGLGQLLVYLLIFLVLAGGFMLRCNLK